jgi:hypothetical protein
LPDGVGADGDHFFEVLYWFMHVLCDLGQIEILSVE